jgi:YnbE-like lipoprotein
MNDSKRQVGLLARSLMASLALAGAASLGGCISVNAPAKPIVIQLDINIKGEVAYKVTADAAKTIEANKGVF